jgi:hypothetical protein
MLDLALLASKTLDFGLGGFALGAQLLSTFTNPRYTDEFFAADKCALVVHAEIGDLEAEGVQLLRFNQDGLINDITVILRPIRAAMALAEALGRG